jgi:endonuclease/exonuclease/phosphatase family metal-dependent hydrolase
MNFDPEIETGNFAPQCGKYRAHAPFRVIDWNIDRGLKLGGIIEFLDNAKPDLILLQEVDINARRTHQLNVAREIAQRLRMNYVFGREFQELTQGDNKSPAYHGQATLSPWSLSNQRIIHFRKQSHFWRPRWFLPNVEPFQERLGGRIALVSEVNAGGRRLLNYNLHLESRGDDTIRSAQLNECLDDVRRVRTDVAIVMAGDFNLDVFRSSAAHEIVRAGFESTAAKEPARTTPPRSLFERGRVIDWILTRGPVRAAKLCVHNSVSASDHFPLSVNLDLT